MTPLENEQQIDRILLYIVVALAALVGLALVLSATVRRLDRLELHTGPDCVKVAVMTPDGVTSVCSP